ncbi:MAG TPA: hypothetical protein VNA20_03070 [Frankiaceae bacterium]|nr:hypothetical protein [Frankiaceae bacterium]
MLSRLAAAFAVMCTVVLPAPPAFADTPEFRCTYSAVRHDVTGSLYVGVLTGIIFHADVSTVRIRCRVTVNGVTVASTSTGSGTSVATTHGVAPVWAGDTDVVRVCADFESTHTGVGTVCGSVQATQVPPRVVYDIIDGALAQVWPIGDTPICSLPKLLAPGVGPVVINSQGDVYVDGRPYYDCPPYDIAEPTAYQYLIGPADVLYGWVTNVPFLG